MSAGRQLREMMASGNLVVAPGAYDGLTARLIRQADFGCVYMTGGGTSCSLGYPDYGLLTMTEMVQNAGRIVDAVDVPVIADADNGYGNELNVFRTIRESEKAGVAGVHIEDQAFPKRCGHLDDKELISLDDYLAKIRAATDARRSNDFVLIARTDARATLGFAVAVRRCNAALAAGADVALFEAPQTLDEVRAVPHRSPDHARERGQRWQDASGASQRLRRWPLDCDRAGALHPGNCGGCTYGHEGRTTSSRSCRPEPGWCVRAGRRRRGSAPFPVSW